MGRWRQEVANNRIRPRQNRHVWIDFGDNLDPMQGLVIDWKREAYLWQALVVFVDENHEPTAVVQQWIPAASLKPVPIGKQDMPRRTGRPDPH